jgi:hypothetical protein
MSMHRKNSIGDPAKGGCRKTATRYGIALRRLTILVCLAWPTFALGYDHGAWDRLLNAHVVPIRNGVSTQVDYGGMARERAALKAYLDGLSAVTTTEIESWPESERLAFLINAYNAWTVELILTAWPDLESIRDLGGLIRTPWRKRFIPLLGEVRSLDDIEHGMIRAKGVYDEPRIHFAVNCASIGCPALRAEAYDAARLDSQLEDATQRFLADRSRNRLEDGRLMVSSVFKWYGGDFTRAGGVHGFLAAYAEPLGISGADAEALRANAIPIDYLDYDWGLNRTP